MGHSISAELESRLERIAQQRNCSLEELLSDYADRIDDIRFPSDPYRFFELPDTLIQVTDAAGKLVYVNPTLGALLGYDAAELVGQSYPALVHPDDITRTQAAESRLRIEGHALSSYENRCRCQDGSYRWLLWVAVLDGDYTYAVAFNVTPDRKMAQQMERTLRENERLLRSIFDGYFLGDMTGRILEVNQPYCDMVGYTREELLQKTVFEMDAVISRQAINLNVKTLMDTDTLITIETQHRHKNGHLVDVEINNIQLLDGQNACFIRDISERKRLERELRHSEQLYRGLIESQIDLVCRYTPDTILTYANDAYCHFIGASAAEILGRRFLDLLVEQNATAIQARIKDVLRNPAPDVRIFPVVNRNGQQQWIQWIDYGITDERGTVVEIQAVGRDVTRLIETQEKLAEREDMLSTILRNIPVMVVQLNAAGEYQYVNQHFVDVLGWKLHEMHDTMAMMTEFYPDPAERAVVLKHIHEADGQWRDYRTRTRDGTVLDMSWANIRLADGHRLGIGQVITHRVELENQRVYAQQLEIELEKEREMREMKDRFVSLVSHEFRTPLTIITTSLSLVTEYFDRLPPGRVLEKLGTVQQQIQRMVEMMEDALRYSRSGAGKTEFVTEPVEIFPLCQHIIETQQIMDDNRHNILLSGDTGIVQADPHLLDHIITNLLTNAIKYSPQHTTITVTITRQPAVWHFAVRDEGMGVPEADLPKLFEPFHRAANARQLPGTGLGLSIVRDYVVLHGGNIMVESEIGQGATFTFTLPA